MQSFKTTLISIIAMCVPLSAATAGPNCAFGGSLSSQITAITVEGLSLSDRGIGAGVNVGCNVDLTAEISLGARLGYDIAKDKGNGIDGSWQAVGVLGYRINQHVMPYALAGVGGAKVNYDNAYKVTHSGFVGGAGVEIGLDTRWSVVTEYSRQWLKSKDFDGVSVTPTADTVRLGVSYKLF